MEIKKVGVVGCGIMGAGIAQVCAQSGYQVVVSEINEKLLNKGLSSIDSFLSRGMERGKVTAEEKNATIGRIQGTVDMSDFCDCDLVIEAVSESLELKKRVFAQLSDISPKHAILASNTSCLPITNMAAATSKPDKVLGLHFFNPPPLMRLLEIVVTIVTSDETLDTAKSFAKSLGKTTVVVRDTPGFISTRLFMPLMLDAIRMVEAKTATRDDIDLSMRLGRNYPMGPLALSDLIGLDTVYSIATHMYEQLKDVQYAPPPLLEKIVALGWLGRKTGKGFYDY